MSEQKTCVNCRYYTESSCRNCGLYTNWEPKNYIIHSTIKSSQTKPCDDTISRQAAIYAISHAQVNFNVESEIDFTNHKREVNEIIFGVLDAQEKALKDLPSIQPQKIGKWIQRVTFKSTGDKVETYLCSRCREEYSYDAETGIKITNYDYCPNCGAKMEGGEDEICVK